MEGAEVGVALGVGDSVTVAEGVRTGVHVAVAVGVGAADGESAVVGDADAGVETTGKGVEVGVAGDSPPQAASTEAANPARA